MLVAIVAGTVATYRVSGFPPSFQQRSHQIAIADVRVLLDTPDSQIVAVSPKGSETLGARANLLANLMAEGEIRSAIASRARLQPKQIVSVAPEAIEPQTVTTAAVSNPHAKVLTTTVVTNDVGEQLPIIDVEAQAPDIATAARLADAAVAGLGDYLDSKAAIESVPDARRLRVTGLGAAQAHVEQRGRSYLIANATALLVFILLCALLLAFGAVVRGWRAAAKEEDDGDASERPAIPKLQVAPSFTARPGSAPFDREWTEELPELPRHGSVSPPDAAR